MPIMDGYETIRAIRAIDRFKTLPIIAVTGKVMTGERQRCIEAGANDYVPKPVDTADLFRALWTWLPAFRQPDLSPLSSAIGAVNSADEQRPQGGLPMAAGTETNGTMMDRHRSYGSGDSAINGTKILVVDDDFRNIFALSALLERSHAEVFVAESGSEALGALERDPGHRHRPDGHHDADDGRLRDDPRHPGRSTAFPISPSSP